MPATGAMRLTTPLREVAGIGTSRAAALASLGLTNIGRLIAHLPMRHERHEGEAAVGEIAPGQIVAVRGQVTATRIVQRGRRPRFEAVLLDEAGGRLDVVWFNQPYLRTRIMPGMRLRVEGQARRFGPGMQMANPRHEVLRDSAEPAAREARLRPVYPASEEVTSRQVEDAIQRVLPEALPLLEDHLPEAYRLERALPRLRDAYRMMHAPANEEEVSRARRRLAFDELLLLQLGVHMRRAQLRRGATAPALKWSERIDARIRARFGFGLTPAQDRVVREIAGDLTRATPMNRLLQGDVGSGKTVVAVYAMLMAVASGHQAALMAPTEILAEQHFAGISEMLAGAKVRLELLTGTTAAPLRKGILRGLAAGEIDVVIGTHALLTETVEFNSLAVAIIDEQHRFGVHQRARLRAKGAEPARPSGERRHRAAVPHVLVMTATPIPRTLAITIFGDLDVSTITALPPGRRPIRTRVVEALKREEVYAHVRMRIERGEQAYIVVPAIDGGGGEGSLSDVRGVMDWLGEVGEGPLAGKRLAALHGRLKRAMREQIMGRFRSGLIDALVATTVIEVGVDVPSASVMVVEHAERFGLAQLHQLRGRVGRGPRQSLCVLIDASEGEATPEAAERLEAMAKISDGFALAEKDMELRGFGELFGTRQSGIPPFRIADLRRDGNLLRMAQRDAAAWIERSPGLDEPEESRLKRRLLKAHGKWLGLGDVG